MAKFELDGATVEAKVNELHTRLAAALALDNKATRQTKSYNIRKELRIVKAVEELLSDRVWDVSDETAETLTNLFALSEQKVYAAVYVNKGERLGDVLKRYADRKDVMNKISKYCNENGLYIDYSDYTFKAL